MASTSERTFAQRYTKARALVEYLNTLPAYAASAVELETSKLSDFLDSIETANSDVASKLSAVQTIRDERFTLYKGDAGLIKRAAQIRDYIASVLPSGKKARDFSKAQKLVQKMRGKRLTKKPPAGENGVTPKTISVYETSFGSLLGTGRELLEVIKTVPGFNPGNANITVAGFEGFLDTADAKNNSVAQQYEQYDNSVEARGALYADLQDRVTKIKLAIAAQYGKDSNEYKDVVKY